MCKLELVDVGGPVDRAKAFGRIAFSCPSNELADIQANVEAKAKTVGASVKTPLVR